MKYDISNSINALRSIKNEFDRPTKGTVEDLSDRLGYVITILESLKDKIKE